MENASRQNIIADSFVSILATMNIGDELVTKALGFEQGYMSKLREKGGKFEIKKDESKKVLDFITAMENLFHLVGKRPEAAVAWLNEKNRNFSDQSPLEFMSSDSNGFQKVCSYLKESNNRG